jgi:hypothetical protein
MSGVADASRKLKSSRVDRHSALISRHFLPLRKKPGGVGLSRKDKQLCFSSPAQLRDVAYRAGI